jgi:hypothetical protein
LFACLLLAVGWFAGRGLVYGLIEANVGWSAERYMRCVSPLFLPILFLATAWAATLLRKTLRQNQSAITKQAVARSDQR